VAGVKYVLDTNVVSKPIKAQPSGTALAYIAAHASELAIAAISWQEMHFGLNLLPAGSRRERIRAYLETRVRPTLPILPFDSAAAEWQARQRARWSQIGRTPAYADSQSWPGWSAAESRSPRGTCGSLVRLRDCPVLRCAPSGLQGDRANYAQDTLIIRFLRK
jgi:tRNA(fMet)-specific endonuclease VapC